MLQHFDDDDDRSFSKKARPHRNGDLNRNHCDVRSSGSDSPERFAIVNPAVKVWGPLTELVPLQTRFVVSEKKGAVGG